MDGLTLSLGAVALVFLILTGAVTAGGTAVYALSASRVRTLEEEGFHGANALARLRKRGELRSALALLAMVLRLFVVGLGAAAGAASLGPLATLIALPVLIAVVLVVGQLVPAGVAARLPVRVALTAAPLLLPSEWLIRAAFGPWIRLGDRVSGRNLGEPDEPGERVVRDMTRLGQEEGVVDVDENLLVERAFRLDELTAWDVMTPRVDVIAWSDELVLSDIVEQLTTVPYSRVPLFHGSVDEITGILYVRDAYVAYVSGGADTVLKRVAREPLFVPGSLSLSHLLRAFQTRHIHMAVVADEFGGTDGVVTLEDVVEELVGEIRDETDVTEQPIIRISADELLVDAGVDLRDINYALGTALPHAVHRSLNGLILEEVGRVPEPGEVIEQTGVKVEIVEVTDTHVVRARVRKTSLPRPDHGQQPSVEKRA